MSKRFLARVMAGTLTVALLLTGLCGCGKGADTPAPTDATTTVGDTTTTTPDETTAPQTDATTTPNASAADAPTTAPTSKPTPAYQIGGDKVVLDGEVFTLGGSPDALFAHFGKPNKVEDNVDPESGVGDVHLYYYENIIIKTHSLRLKNGEKREMVRGIGFPNNHYSFDGIAVGTSAKELDQKVSPRVEGWVNWVPTLDIFGGLYHQYPPVDHSKCLTYWQFFLTFEGETPMDAQGNVVVPADSVVESIEIRYPIKDFIDQYRDELDDRHGSDISAF